MATAVHASASHVASNAFGSFSASSPRGVELEDRLDLSLDALIKERKKEEKAKKREEGATKPKGPSAPAKTQSHEAQKTAVKSQQTAKRSAIVSKNRGFPTSPAAEPNAAQKTAKKSAKKAVSKTKTSITEVTAQLKHKIRQSKTGGQQRTSIKSSKKATATQYKPTTQRIVRKQDKQPATRPNNTPANQQAKKQTAAANQSTKTKDRSVVRADSKKGKLQITFSAGNDSSKWSKKTNATKRQQTPAAKTALPGKLSAKVNKQHISPKKTGKQPKKSRKHQMTTSVVRQPFTQRKKKN